MIYTETFDEGLNQLVSYDEALCRLMDGEKVSSLWDSSPNLPTLSIAQALAVEPRSVMNHVADTVIGARLKLVKATTKLAFTEYELALAYRPLKNDDPEMRAARLGFMAMATVPRSPQAFFERAEIFSGLLDRLTSGQRLIVHSPSVFSHQQYGRIDPEGLNYIDLGNPYGDLIIKLFNRKTPVSDTSRTMPKKKQIFQINLEDQLTEDLTIKINEPELIVS